MRRYRCAVCKKTYTEEHQRLIDAMILPEDKILAIVNMLVEGVGIRSIERLTGVHRDTILRVLIYAGEKCEKLMGRLIVNVPVKDVQVDEIWGFIQKKEAHKAPHEARDNSIGDAYTFVAIERNTKLVLNFALGRRDTATTQIFIEGVRTATAAQPYQVSTDGFGPYVPAIDDTLGDRVDFAQLIKVYAAPHEGQQRYSPADVVGTQKKVIIGRPDPARICTSHVERQNL
ncbi:MAG TPA: hypothetical protein VG675_00020, partial [Bryobacteraceae bacterium]|nr:hypothetical protein [Bryobacteraceae bacterium]